MSRSRSHHACTRFAFFSNLHATRNRIAGGAMSSQRIKKPTSQSPFRITQASSRMRSMASVKIPPTSCHRQATNNPTRANPVRLSRNTSTVATGPGPPESGSKKMSKRKAVTRILQIRAIQRRIFADWGTAYEVLMATLLLGEEIASSTTCGTARLAKYDSAATEPRNHPQTGFLKLGRSRKVFTMIVHRDSQSRRAVC